MKNIKENNILIALFMGAEYVNDALEDFPKGYYIYEELPFEPEEWQFHHNWSWLMPVVEKIEQDTGWELIMYSSDCFWNKFGEYPDNVHICFTGTRLEGVYKAIIYFIKWYNNEKEN